MLDHDGTGFHPIARIHISDAEIVVHGRVVNMAADHAVDLLPPRFRRQKLLEAADEVHRVLHLQFGPSRQGPVGETEPAPRNVEVGVDEKSRRIGSVPKEGEPAGMPDDQIELISMDHEIALSIRRLMDRMVGERDSAQADAHVIAQELVVVSGHVDEGRALAHLAEQFLHHVVMALRPIPARFEPPSIDDVADEIDRLGVIGSEKVQERLRLATFRAQMEIRQEQRANADRIQVPRHATPFLDMISHRPNGIRISPL